MTQDQQAALEALPGRILTVAEIILAGRRDDALLAASLTVGCTQIGECYLTDAAFAGAITAASGGTTAMADSILNKLDAAASVGRSVKAVTNRLYNDPRGINWGDPILRAWFYAQTPERFTTAECAAVLALSLQPRIISTETVTAILGGIA